MRARLPRAWTAAPPSMPTASTSTAFLNPLPSPSWVWGSSDSVSIADLSADTRANSYGTYPPERCRSDLLHEIDPPLGQGPKSFDPLRDFDAETPVSFKINNLS